MAAASHTLALLKQRACAVFNGKDEVLTAGLSMGADGGIGSFYNLISELLVEVYALARRRWWPAAPESPGRASNATKASRLAHPRFR